MKLNNAFSENDSLITSSSWYQCKNNKKQTERTNTVTIGWKNVLPTARKIRILYHAVELRRIKRLHNTSTPNVLVDDVIGRQTVEIQFSFDFPPTNESALIYSLWTQGDDVYIFDMENFMPRGLLQRPWNCSTFPWRWVNIFLTVLRAGLRPRIWMKLQGLKKARR